MIDSGVMLLAVVGAGAALTFFGQRPPKLDPLPKSKPRAAITIEKPPKATGVYLGRDKHNLKVYWDIAKLQNPHACIAGSSGSGKTQTLRALALELHRNKIGGVVLDLHGDLEIENMQTYQLHLNSTLGINPLRINLDPDGGGSHLQALHVAHTIKLAFKLGPKQEAALVGYINRCYISKGILNSDIKTRTLEPPTFADLETFLQSEDEDLFARLATLWAYKVFSRQNIPIGSSMIRVDISKLPEQLQLLAADAITEQIFRDHQLAGLSLRIRSYLIVDEVRVFTRAKDSPLERISLESRKFGLGLILASQSLEHFQSDILANAATKIVMNLESAALARGAKLLNLSKAELEGLDVGEALVIAGRLEPQRVKIRPYSGRVKPTTP